MNKKILGVLFLSVFLSACSSSPKSEGDDEYKKIMIEHRKELKVNMTEIAQRAYNAQRMITQINNAQALTSDDFSPDVMRNVEFQATHIPVGMERTMSINWQAYPEEILKLLANASGYRIEFLGNKYPIARVVNLDPTPKTIKRLIDDVEMQSKDYIHKVDIFENSKLIRVYYTQP